MSEVVEAIESIHDERVGQEDKLVYVIGHEDGYVKIGVSDLPHRRVEELQTACPKQLRLLNYVGFANPERAEAVIHREMDAFRVRGEWFDLPHRIEKEVVDSGSRFLKEFVNENMEDNNNER